MRLLPTPRPRTSVRLIHADPLHPPPFCSGGDHGTAGLKFSYSKQKKTDPSTSPCPAPTSLLFRGDPGTDRTSGAEAVADFEAFFGAGGCLGLWGGGLDRSMWCFMCRFMRRFANCFVCFCFLYCFMHRFAKKAQESFYYFIYVCL